MYTVATLLWEIQKVIFQQLFNTSDYYVISEENKL